MNLQNRDSIAAKTFIALLLVLIFGACSASNYDDGEDEPRRPSRRAVADDDTQSAPAVGGLMLPPADWWRQAEIADMVKPSADQVAALDKLQTEQGDEIAKLERDMTVAERDLRTTLEGDKPTTDAIITAGQRIKTMRDDIFDRQLRYLAAERTILTREQWSALQDAVRMRRRDRMRDGYGGRGPGGRGGYPGMGGRRPRGFPGW